MIFLFFKHFKIKNHNWPFLNIHQRFDKAHQQWKDRNIKVPSSIDAENVDDTQEQHELMCSEMLSLALDPYQNDDSHEWAMLLFIDNCIADNQDNIEQMTPFRLRHK